jgi:hypothetical protein
MEILPNVPLQGIIQSHFSSEVIKKEIQDRLLHIPNIDFLKGTIQMVSLVCNMVEELTPANNRNKGKLDKKQMALDILAKLFELTQLEIGISGKNIDYLIDSKAIRRAGKCKKSMNWMKSKFGEKNTSFGSPE